MAVSKRTRYEVLRRDNHTCRYCGASAPDVVLTVDHVVPVALGGSDDPTNLVAACRDCNAGKASASPDEAVVADVAQDALRWRRALEVAQRLAQEERDAQAVNLDAFHRKWSSYHYTSTGEPVDLPGAWKQRVREVFLNGLTIPDVDEAVDIAMSARRVDDEFAYFLGVCRQRIAQRQAVAQELLRRGAVD